MSCGKRPLVKKWDKPKDLRVIKPSRYEQNELSVKQHWKNVIRALELSYKDETFWDSQGDMVRELVGSKIYSRIVKIFNLPVKEKPYEPHSDISLGPSDIYYQNNITTEAMRRSFSMSDFDPSMYVDIEDENDEDITDEESEIWTISTSSTELKKLSRSKSILRTKSLSISKSVSNKMLSKFFSKKSLTRQSKTLKSSPSSVGELATTLDDLEVQMSEKRNKLVFFEFFMYLNFQCF
ncbi:unnamed protein product [Euphydryas editha]|uniref:MADF domain-containing protein n=1 Tax=Euphydryas editha TaxID=104508 RepID=A0AAU9U536_EUPED|nr:unnamed protein product [Euphydryas editha]